jgi:hypothetical protein
MQHSTRGYWITFINKLVVAAFLLYYTVVIRPVALLWRGFIFEEISEWIAHKIREVVFTFTRQNWSSTPLFYPTTE